MNILDDRNPPLQSGLQIDTKKQSGGPVMWKFFRCIGASLVIFSGVLGASSAHPEDIGQNDLFLSRTAHDAENQRMLGFKPRRDSKPWLLQLPLDWSSDPFSDLNWRFQLNAWRMIDPLILEFYKTGDESNLLEALAFIEDWHAFHVEPDYENRFAWYDMAAGIRALRLAFFLDLVQRKKLQVADQTVHVLEQLSVEHARRLQERSYISTGNHGLFQVFGLNLLCKVAAELPDCQGARKFAADFLRDELLPAQFTPQGVHREHSPDYHLFTIRAIERLGGTRHIDVPEVREAIDRAVQITPWLVFSTGEFARIGDSGGRSKPLETDPEQPICLVANLCYAVGDFTESGYAIIRSLPSNAQSSMLFVMGMAMSTAHKHADDLSFELFEFGRFIFIDSGKYGYEADDMRTYVESADAHNTISLEDRPIGPREVKMSGSLLEPIKATPNGFVIRGTVERPGLFTQNRQIDYIPGKSLKVTDRVASPWLQIWPRTFVSSLHLAPDLEPIMNPDGFTLELGTHRVDARLVADGCALTAIRGQDNPPLGWYSTGYLTMEPTTVIRASCRGRSGEITWDMEFQ